MFKILAIARVRPLLIFNACHRIDAPVRSCFYRTFANDAKDKLNQQTGGETEERKSKSSPEILKTKTMNVLEDDSDIEETENMFALGPDGTMEHGGPTRGGKYAEPTRFGDWERCGRCSDF